MTADERGSFRIVEMKPGTYRVEASQSGFAPVVVPDEIIMIRGKEKTVEVVGTKKQ